MAPSGVWIRSFKPQVLLVSGDAKPAFASQPPGKLKLVTRIYIYIYTCIYIYIYIYVYISVGVCECVRTLLPCFFGWFVRSAGVGRRLRPVRPEPHPPCRGVDAGWASCLSGFQETDQLDCLFELAPVCARRKNMFLAGACRKHIFWGRGG